MVRCDDKNASYLGFIIYMKHHIKTNTPIKKIMNKPFLLGSST